MAELRYRVGPSGVRRVLSNGVELWVGRAVAIPDDLPFAEIAPPVELLDDIPIVRIRPREDTRTPEERAAELERLHQQQEEAEARHALWAAASARRHRGEPPGFSAWCNDRIVHLSWTPFCSFPVTHCGLRLHTSPDPSMPLGRRWRTAVGILPEFEGRVCKRCQWHVARAMAKAASEEAPSIREYFEYRPRGRTNTGGAE